MTGPYDFTIDFVCTGNICRSPMAEYIVRHRLEEAGLNNVRVASSGIGDWHVGHPADDRALTELSDHGYDGSAHRARQVDPDTLGADLIVALATNHRSELIARGADPAKIRLLRDFDPVAGEDVSVADPYYGGAEGFSTTRQEIEAAAEGIVDYVREQLGKN
ncbi:protein tyrosine phosphatase [Corynebacterium yudongzhengii]|uniref:protein-tyrosine-phosphatase n=1 Tax=Corynebacterium yudongzhengii TaxID=2080740 RepID=A0A2U1T7G0_9CORY|nr:low molecular weight protein-tyrosine-phosphatase [Corynebacterium yudongzhengii]AWB81500.1 protein tyrosine phosphatase [Corynebacterium yudongzhengii]PWC01929.1 low molecular weight phosphotyrosine protein phosphatase [Corynebacterium yudongzhengii]